MRLDSMLTAPGDGCIPHKKRHGLIGRILDSAYSEAKRFYDDNVKVKLRLAYAVASTAADRILTYVVIRQPGGEEANPIQAGMINYFGFVQTAVTSLVGVNVALYGLSRFITSKRVSDGKISNDTLLGSMYTGVGLSESLVSFHNYLVAMHNNLFDFTYINYPEFLVPSSLLVAAPILYAFWKNRDKKPGAARI